MNLENKTTEEVFYEFIANYWTESALIVFSAILLFISIYPNFRLFVFDLLKCFLGIFKFTRRIYLANEITTSINQTINDFNKQLPNPFINKCKIKWVKNYSDFEVKPGEPIVCVGFNKRESHDQRFYNAVKSYVEKGLLLDSKPFLNYETIRAIDLLTLSLILKENKREALNLFKYDYKEEGENTKNKYKIIKEGEDKGLFRNIFLQEIYFLGQNLDEESPTNEIIQETEEFLGWFYQLVTRDKEEGSKLIFETRNFKVAVILISNLETYNNYGVRPYLKRAYQYANEKFNCFYLVGRGRPESKTNFRANNFDSLKVVDEVFRNLMSHGGFKLLNSSSKYYRFNIKNEKYPIKCIAIKPDNLLIKSNAWENLQKIFNEGGYLYTPVEEVKKNTLFVNAFGLKFKIDAEDLSFSFINDLRSYFNLDNYLELEIIEFNKEKEFVRFSNHNTSTDPAILIQKKVDSAQPFVLEIKKILAQNGNEFGLIVEDQNDGIQGFIHRNNAVKSRYENLSDYYSVGNLINVDILNYNPDHKRYDCKVEGVESLWEDGTIDKFEINSRVTGVIREITESFLIIELDKGIEGHLFVKDLSWKSMEENQQEIKNFDLGDKIEVIIKSIDKSLYQIGLSRKRLTSNPYEVFFNNHSQEFLDARVYEISEGKGIKIIFEDFEIEGFIPVREVTWVFCYSIRELIPENDFIRVQIYDYDERRVFASRKRAIQNDFDKVFSELHKDKQVAGKVLGVNGDTFRVMVFINDLVVQAYVYKYELTNFYVDNESFKNVLIEGETYDFLIKRVDSKLKIIELSRKRFLKKFINSMDYSSYGEVYSVYPINKKGGYIYLYGNYIEGIMPTSEKVTEGEKTEVIISRIDRVKNKLELEVSE